MKKTPKERILFNNYYDDDWFEAIKKDLTELNDKEPTDNEVFEEMYVLQDFNWEAFEEEFKDFITSHRTFILQGNVGRWNGRHRGGFTFDSFEELHKAWEDCDYIKVYDENGHLYIECSHHDADNYYEIKELTERGEEYLNHHCYDDEEHVHDMLMKYYSRLPRFAEKVWRSPRQEWIN